jgi:hypothetical protein
MRRALVPVSLLAALATLGFLIAVGLTPVHRGLAAQVYVLTLGGLGLLFAVQAVRGAAPASARSSFDRSLRSRPKETERPAELERLEREVWLATSSAFHEHHRLRRTVTTIARERLRERRGLELAEARELLGPELWELVRPDRDLPDDRDARGVSPRELTAAVDALERI